MTDPDTWFLLVQYRRCGETSVSSFNDADEAAAAYNEAEQYHQDKLKGPDAEMDVLLVGASSLDVVKRRYPSYFLSGRSKSAKVKHLLAALPAVPAR
ncbi:hypothetical protein [Parasphingorhabdus pacifica]